MNELLFQIKGKYKICQDNIIIYEGENLITSSGEWFFLNRCINNDYTPMKYIVMGNGESVPLKTDERLGNLLTKKTASRIANLKEKAVDLKASFTASEVIGTTEIGVMNTDNVLISHDVFKEIKSENLTNPIGAVEITYSFQFSTATMREGWINTLVNNQKVYYIYEPSNIIGVYENITKNGYKKVPSTAECASLECSYYYDVNDKLLYVHTTGKANPDSLELIIQS